MADLTIGKLFELIGRLHAEVDGLKEDIRKHQCECTNECCKG